MSCDIHLAPRIHVSNCKRNISLALRIRPQLLVLIVDVQVDVAGFHVPSALLHLCAFVSYIGLHSVPTKLKIAYNITLLCNHASTVVVIRSCSTPTLILSFCIGIQQAWIKQQLLDQEVPGSNHYGCSIFPNVHNASVNLK